MKWHPKWIIGCLFAFLYSLLFLSYDFLDKTNPPNLLSHSLTTYVPTIQKLIYIIASPANHPRPHTHKQQRITRQTPISVATKHNQSQKTSVADTQLLIFLLPTPHSEKHPVIKLPAWAPSKTSKSNNQYKTREKLSSFITLSNYTMTSSTLSISNIEGKTSQSCPINSKQLTMLNIKIYNDQETMSISKLRYSSKRL